IKEKNRLLNQTRTRILRGYNDLVSSNEEIVLKKLKAIAKGQEEKGLTFLEALEKSKQRSGLRPNTIRRIQVTIDNLKLFLKDEFGKEDIHLRDLLKNNYKGFDIRYVDWCTTKTTVRFDGSIRYPKKHETAIREVRHFRKAINMAVQLGEMDKNPLIAEFKIPKDEKTKREVLTLEELKKLMELDLSDKLNMDRIRDCFVFQCFTGLAFVDIDSLKKEHLFKRNERTWIIKERV
ncbi:phage integrase SAM-like domain-containing protein, partial [uncultured Microscilla sp.]|uniref:phage integrase SAM-like domain-containing protein n=1 Tax=uncultured Microscilla sp. TaxID=432653 RepID=UPI00262A85DC